MAVSKYEQKRPDHHSLPLRTGNGHARSTADKDLNKLESDTGGASQRKARALIYEQGERAEFVYEIIDGTVMLSKALPDGRRQIVEILGSGSLFGFSPAGDYSCRAQALTRVSLSIMDGEQAKASAHIQQRYAGQVMRKLDVLQDHALLLGRKSAIERIASFLLSLPHQVKSGATGAGHSGQQAFCRTRMNQREIGDYLGLKVETISRNLAILKRQMIIAKGKRGQFELLDLAALRRLAGPPAGLFA